MLSTPFCREPRSAGKLAVGRSSMGSMNPALTFLGTTLQVLAFPEDFKPRNSSDILMPKPRAKIFVTPVFRKFFQRTMRILGVFLVQVPHAQYKNAVQTLSLV